jgi:hypothetical protein
VEEPVTKDAPILLAAAMALVLAGSGPAVAQSSGDQLEITAFAINMGNIVTGSTATVDITVNSWSSAAERERLITTMLEKGADALLRELQKAPVKGRFRIPAARRPDPHHLSLGLDIRYAWQTELPEGGRRIVLAFDRYIGMAEVRNQPRTIDYPFTLIEIRVDKEGSGQGKMSVATKINFDKKKNELELENYSTEPVRLNEVRVKVKS